MKIDITREPLADIFRNRGRYRLIATVLLALSGCGLLLGAYAILSETPYSENLEMVAFTLFVGPILGFSYFGEKLQAYKKMTADQEKDLVALGWDHPEIKEYCTLVENICQRQPILAEYEACQSWAEDASRKNRPKE